MDITTAEYTAARTFLHQFRKIYTLNYDMLLYWAVMEEIEPDVPTNDGFTNGDEPDADYVVWEPYFDFGEQRLFFSTAVCTSTTPGTRFPSLVPAFPSSTRSEMHLQSVATR